MSKEIKFVTGEAALTIGKALVVTDLHIGIEYRYRKSGIALPSQLKNMSSRLDTLLDRTGAERLVILGDVKHKVPGTSFQEEREIPAFFRGLVEKVRVELAPGNHDGGIEALLPEEVAVYPRSGFRLGDVWLCHGHAWPEQEFLKSKAVVIGHNHSGFEFRDGLGYRWTEQVWVRAGLEKEGLSGRYKDLGESLPELVLMPSFNRFTGLIPLNREGVGSREGPSPLFRVAKRAEARIFMLDGTFLGELGEL